MMRVKEFIKENRNNIIRDIGRVVKFENPVDALHEMLSVARDLGLEVFNCNDIVGYAYIGSNSDDYIATITHVDIVPAGDGWNSDPFTLVEKDGYIIGRGVMDDKGPGVLCLYALKYLKENTDIKIPVRALFGTDEESGMDDVKYYLANYAPPRFLFSPDADFPIINGEKGIFGAELYSKIQLRDIEEIKGGFAPNAMPCKASAMVCGKEFAAEGVQAHASLPQNGVNAIGVLLKDILDSGILKGDEKKLVEAYYSIDRDWDGEAIGIKCSDDKFGDLTCVGGVVDIRDGRLYRTIDIRYPTSTTGEELLSRLTAFFSDVAEIKLVSNKVPFYMDADKPEVKACIDAYNEVTGTEAKPICIGGGTYARAFPSAVAFGPENNGESPEFVGAIHASNEGASVEELMTALEIYIKALINLEK